MADEERVEADYLHRRRRNAGENAAVKLHKASNATVSLAGLKSLRPRLEVYKQLEL